MNELDLLKLQSAYMRGDPIVVALCKQLTPELVSYWEGVDYIVDWTNINLYPDEILDELAWEHHIDWYDKGASLDVKRKLIQNSDKVHMRLGTPWAVEQVFRDYFGSGEVKEWFEYGGEPGYFRLYTSARLGTVNDVIRFLQILERVKRKSAWLEGMFTNTQGGDRLHTGGLSLHGGLRVSGIAHQL